MADQLLALIVDESKWLAASMTVALFTGAVVLGRSRGVVPVRRRVLAAMSLFLGVTIGMMAFGHLLAVTTKLTLGTIEGPVVLFFAIGLVLAVPSWWLVAHTWWWLRLDAAPGRLALALNGAVALVLLGLGLHNLPLAAPALFNAGYQLHSRRAIGWAIVGLAVVANVGLFVGSLVFLASGQTFEQFRGLE